MVPSGASASTPAGVGISALPTVSSRYPTSCAAVGSPPLGFSAVPFPPLQRGSALPAHGPDAAFLERLSPEGRCHGHFQENSAFDILGAEASPTGAAPDFGVAPVDAVEVAYNWKPVHQVAGRKTTSGKFEQVVATKNLESDGAVSGVVAPYSQYVLAVDVISGAPRLIADSLSACSTPQVPVPMEHDELKTHSGSGLQSLSLKPTVEDPRGLSEADSYEETSSAALEPIGSTTQHVAIPVGGCHESAREVLGCPLHRLGWRHQLLQEAQSSSHEGFAGLNGCKRKKINSIVDLDITPESINLITSKYSLADPVRVEPSSVSPRSSPDGDQLDGIYKPSERVPAAFYIHGCFPGSSTRNKQNIPNIRSYCTTASAGLQRPYSAAIAMLQEPGSAFNGKARRPGQNPITPQQGTYYDAAPKTHTQVLAPATRMTDELTQIEKTKSRTICQKRSSFL
ncbi:hypothetical protein Nepgr_006679 [Nepenthes gracilis]|uniref:Uncharacterized protein n=1 Tax=Nepenthes gracilis TaxID=150966 RepID=A0AAD3S5T5_NEPGR|nr:hypothetical protein Nepgr_006679 [Nepenthes gracilis]